MKLISIFILSLSLINISAKNNKPNIIWIFSDDHSYQTIGTYGGRLQGLNPTPNLDKLASEGMRFNKCYVENSIWISDPSEMNNIYNNPEAKKIVANMKTELSALRTQYKIKSST